MHKAPVEFHVDQIFAEFSEIFQSCGLRPGLAFLVGLTSFRFIAIFCLRKEKVRAIAFYDRLHPTSKLATEDNINATYCSYVRDENAAFAISDSHKDGRIGDHPKRAHLRSYVGFPIIDPAGNLLGTICHYDTEPRDTRQVDMELMFRVIRLLAEKEVIPSLASLKT